MTHEHKHHHSCCGCIHDLSKLNMARRTFLAAVGGTAIGAKAVLAATDSASGSGTAMDYLNRPIPSAKKKPLVVQPIFTYHLYKKRDQTSWRPWGGFHTQEDVQNECARIEKELAEMKQKAEFPLEILPLLAVSTPQEMKQAREAKADVAIIYGAIGEIDPLFSEGKHHIVFVRHRSGPAYLWYEIVHPRFLRKTVDTLGEPRLSPQDVVVDEYGDMLWRLRAFYGLKNSVGCKVVCIGGPSGWGEGGRKSPDLTKEKFKMELIDYPYTELDKRIQSAVKDSKLCEQAKKWTKQYLNLPDTKMETDIPFLENAFILTEVFEQIMTELDAPAITVNECMTTIIPKSQTTACMTLSLINDRGAMAFCESDFAVIPSGILLYYLSSKPVFLQDPTYPHHGVVTIAHCTAPRKMDGKNLEPVRILTHYESDYGAAPKVDMRIGETVTVIDPDFEFKKWIGFRGKVNANPFLDICRSQTDIEIEGDCNRLAQDMVGFHWMMCYGDYLKETGYALQKLGIGWYNLTHDRTIEA
ncbi:MAG: sugar isomerase [Candidatus Hydrogenedens sp.]|nr:sugar isomerase [Candidatus Hydrogenedens sp.]